MFRLDLLPSFVCFITMKITKLPSRISGVLDQKLEEVNTDKILQHNRKQKRQDKYSLDTSDVKKKEEASIFTDEDFAVVSKLHFVNSKKAVIVDDD